MCNIEYFPIKLFSTHSNSVGKLFQSSSSSSNPLGTALIQHFITTSKCFPKLSLKGQYPEKILGLCRKKLLRQCPEKLLRQCPEKLLGQCPEKLLRLCRDKVLRQCPKKLLGQCPEKLLRQCP